MEKERYSIIFSSLTGNTKELANAIKEALPKNGCDYFGEADAVEPQSETVYLGFGPIKAQQTKKRLNCLKG